MRSSNQVVQSKWDGISSMKHLMVGALATAFIFLITTPIYATEAADELYQKGILLHDQWQPSADEYIKKAADLGNTKAMCLWAEMNKPSMFIHTEESIKYYKKAKNGGDLCGYAALLTSNDVEEAIQGSTPKNVEDEFLEVAKKKAEQGDSDALFRLSTFTLDKSDSLHYMEMAAEKGNAKAMRTLALSIKDGDGWYLFPGSRNRAVREWMEKSAEAGNPLAMLDLADMYYAEDRSKSILWFNKAVDKGFSRALNFMAVSYSGCYEEAPYKFNVDLTKAYFYAFVIKQSFGDGGIDRMAVDALLPKLEKKMTPAEIKQAKQEAHEWLKTHQVRDYSVEFGMYL